MKKPRIRNEASADERTRAETSLSAAPFPFPTTMTTRPGPS